LCHEFNELVIVGLAVVFGVMTLGRLNIYQPHLGRDNAQLLSLEAANDLANETTLHAVGLHNEEGSIHDEAI
jgi:hypothetical protein